jgi:hypothetical protein
MAQLCAKCSVKVEIPADIRINKILMIICYELQNMIPDNTP